VDENDPAALLKEADEEIKSDHYQIAIDKLKEIKNKFPYSKYSIDAQLKLADVYFLQESYPDAAAAYETFRDLHPKHEKVSYAMYRIGKSYYMDMPDPISRDMTPAKKAMDAYLEFLRRFPQSTDAPDAQKDLADIRKKLSEKELYIADFYFKRDFYDSAKPRYEKVIELYPETDAAKTAQSQIARIETIKKNDPHAGANVNVNPQLQDHP
jgi:outer membrane protein assembly factor BamD